MRKNKHVGCATSSYERRKRSLRSLKIFKINGLVLTAETRGSLGETRFVFCNQDHRLTKRTQSLRALKP
jgi:hypothetical protein